MPSAELLTAKPVSGSVRERHYDLHGLANTWVRFDDGQGDEWVGMFGNGTSDFCAAVPFPDDDGRTVLVIARGQEYVVDARSGILLRRPHSGGDVWSALPAPGRDGILVADRTHIWLAGRTRDDYAAAAEPSAYVAQNPFHRHQVAHDGIIFDAATHSALTGALCEDDTWYPFRMALDDLRVELGPAPGQSPSSAERVATEPHGGYPQSPELEQRMRQYWL
jgi:hypothetical protein